MKPMKVFQSFLIVAFVIYSAFAFSDTDPVWNRIKSSGQIICGAIPNDKPGSWVDDDTGKWKGYEIELCRNIASGLSKAMGEKIEPVFRETNWKSIVLDIQSQKIDLWPGMSATEKRKEALSMVGPGYNLAFCTLSRPGRGNVGKTWESINSPDVTVATPTGTSIEKTFSRLAPKANHLSLASYSEVTIAVQSGRADLMGADILRCLTIASLAPNAFGNVIVPKPVHSAGSSVGVVKGADKLTAWLKKWVSEARKSGKIRQVFLDTFAAAGLDTGKLPDDVTF